MTYVFDRTQHVRFFALMSLLTMILVPTNAAAQIVTSVDQAVSLTGIYPHLGIMQLGFDHVTSITSSNVSGTSTSSSTSASADFSFEIDGDTFTGHGTFLSTESATSLTMDIQLAISDGLRDFEYTYELAGNLAAATRTETVSATLFDNSVVVETYDIFKEESKSVVGNLITTEITATATADGITRDITIFINETVVSATASDFSNTFLDEPTSPSGPPLLLEADYQQVVNPNEEITATFSKYDITSDGDLFLELAEPAAITTTRLDDDNYDVDVFFQLVGSVSGEVEFSVNSPIALTRVSPASGLVHKGDGWSWSDFGKSIVGGAAGGASAGAVTALLTDGAAPLAVGPTAGIGAVAGAVGGAATYTVVKTWDAIFGGSSTPPPTGNTTFINNGIIIINQNATAPSSPLAVSLLNFAAEVSDGKVVLGWTTESEIDNEGFNVLRSSKLGGQAEPVNSNLIPAEGGPAFGASYTFVDDSVRPGMTYFYLLEDISTLGESTLHGAGACTVGVDPKCRPIEVKIPFSTDDPRRSLHD